MIDHLPGTPAMPYVDIEDDGERAAWLLALLNEGPGRTIVAIPRPKSSEDRDDVERKVWRALDRVKATRPEIAVNVLRARYRGDGQSLLILEDQEAA